jgi:hypothetical protein
LEAGGEEVAAMATTKQELDQLARSGPQLDDRAPMALQASCRLTPEAPPRPAARTRQQAALTARTLAGRLSEPITARWAVTGAVAWVALGAVGIAVEPPPANPDAVDPWLVSALGTLLLVALASTLAGFWLRRRWGMAASLVAAGMLVASTLMCPASGHHAGIGAWWVVQLGCGLGLVAASALGLQRAAPR